MIVQTLRCRVVCMSMLLSTVLVVVANNVADTAITYENGCDEITVNQPRMTPRDDGYNVSVIYALPTSSDRSAKWVLQDVLENTASGWRSVAKRDTKPVTRLSTRFLADISANAVKSPYTTQHMTAFLMCAFDAFSVSGLLQTQQVPSDIVSVPVETYPECKKPSNDTNGLKECLGLQLESRHPVTQTLTILQDVVDATTDDLWVIFRWREASLSGEEKEFVRKNKKVVVFDFWQQPRADYPDGVYWLPSPTSAEMERWPLPACNTSSYWTGIYSRLQPDDISGTGPPIRDHINGLRNRLRTTFISHALVTANELDPIDKDSAATSIVHAKFRLSFSDSTTDSKCTEEVDASIAIATDEMDHHPTGGLRSLARAVVPILSVLGALPILAWLSYLVLSGRSY